MNTPPPKYEVVIHDRKIHGYGPGGENLLFSQSTKNVPKEVSPYLGIFLDIYSAIGFAPFRLRLQKDNIVQNGGAEEEVLVIERVGKWRRVRIKKNKNER